MTNQTASDLAKILLDLFKKHDLKDIATFALPQEDPNSNYSESSSDYIYTSTETEFSRLERYAGIEGKEKSTLQEIVDLALTYFELVQNLPTGFYKKLQIFTELKVPSIQFFTNHEQRIDVSSMLNSNETRELIKLLRFIRGNMELNDEDFFESLNQFN